MSPILKEAPKEILYKKLHGHLRDLVSWKRKYKPRYKKICYLHMQEIEVHTNATLSIRAV